MQDGNTSLLNNYTTQNLIFQMAANESITLDGDNILRTEPFGLLEILHSPAVNGTSAIHIISNLDNQPQTDIIDVDVNASTLSSGILGVFNAVIDRGSSTGGTIHVLNVLSSGGGLVGIEAVGVFSGVVVIHHISGVPINMDKALLYDGVFTDVTAAFTNTGNDTAMFIDVFDSVYIGHSSIFGEIIFNLDTLASGAGIRPTFEYSTGGGGWTIFNPIDGTDGMRSDGNIGFIVNDLTGWASDTISGSNLFWLRINRTQVGLGSIPIEDLVQIIVGIDYTWSKDGSIRILNANVTGDLIVDGLSTFNQNITLTGNNITEVKAIEGATGDFFINVGQINQDKIILRGWDVNNAVFRDAIKITSANTILLDIGSTFMSQTMNGNWDFTTGNAENVGNAGNDFLTAGNTLIKTTFSADILISSDLQFTGNGAGLAAETWIEAFGDSMFFNVPTSENYGWQVNNQNQFLMNLTAFYPVTNATHRVGTDSLRFEGWFDVLTSKSQVTGGRFESEIVANEGEIFEDGDVVCLKELWVFTKCSNKYNYILSSVEHIQRNVLVGFENITKYHLIEQTEIYLRNFTDADGEIFLIQDIRVVTEAIRIKQDITLSNGIKTEKDILIQKTIMINVSYTETIPIYELQDAELLLVKDRPTYVKVCSPVTKGQLLIAGLNGCAVGIDFPTERYFAIAGEDSHDGIVGALVGWN